MTSHLHPDAEAAGPFVLQVDFARSSGIREVARSPADLAARSAVAFEEAMATVKVVSERIAETVSGLVVRPSETSVEFGIKLDAEAGALLARAGAEAHLMVTMVWSKAEAKA